MKKLFLLLTIALPILFTSCSKDNDNAPQEVKLSNIYILNYGSYGKEGSLSSFDMNTNKVTNNAYDAANGNKMSGNPQYAYQYKGKLYFMGNSKDEIYSVDPKTLIRSSNGVTKDIIKPRFCVGDGDYLYISCYGGDVWKDTSLGYIIKYDIKTNSVVKKISLPGGPEGLAIAHNKLYCALNYKKEVDVINLYTEKITHINTPAVCSYFTQDKNQNLYVTLVSTYSSPSKKSGIGFINTTTDKLEKTFDLANVSYNYSSIITMNKSKTKIFVLAAKSDPVTYKTTGAVQIFNIKNSKFEDNALIKDIDGINSVSINPKDGNIYIGTSPSASAPGELIILDENGAKSGTYTVGISPAWSIFTTQS